MKLITNNIDEMENILNDIREKSILDIYMETEFSAIGYIISEKLELYRYGESLAFNKENHNFGYRMFLEKNTKNIDYDKIEMYILEEIKNNNIKENTNQSNEEVSKEIINLKSYVQEFNNNDLFKKIEYKLLEYIDN